MSSLIPMWMQRPDILSYIIDCYAGLDNSPNGGAPRRVFLWQEGNDIKMGNSEAFIQHLERKFELVARRGSASNLHKLLRELGEVAQQHKPHAPRGVPDRPYKSPDPDEWIVGHVEPCNDEDPSDG